MVRCHHSIWPRVHRLMEAGEGGGRGGGFARVLSSLMYLHFETPEPSHSEQHPSPQLAGHPEMWFSISISLGCSNNRRSFECNVDNKDFRNILFFLVLYTKQPVYIVNKAI